MKAKNLIVTTVSLLAATAAFAQPSGFTRTALQRNDLSVAGREVVQTVAALSPGVTSSKHAHPGEEIVYVLEGAPE